MNLVYTYKGYTEYRESVIIPTLQVVGNTSMSQEEKGSFSMKIAITGGAGFLGSHLTTAYLDAGHDVIVIDNLNNGSVNAVDPRARFIK